MQNSQPVITLLKIILFFVVFFGEIAFSFSFKGEEENNFKSSEYIPISQSLANFYSSHYQTIIVDNYVSEERIEELASLPKDEFDMARLIKLCEELNQNYAWKNYFAVGALLRTILDHVPPIFKKSNFEQVASDYSWGKSHKSLIMKLCESAKKIAHNLLHKQIKESKAEVLPGKQRVDFKPELDILLAEIVTIIKSHAKGK